MKDNIVFGIRSNQVRGKLNLSRAINICKTSEQATKQLHEFKEKIKQIKSQWWKKEMPRRNKMRILIAKDVVQTINAENV